MPAARIIIAVAIFRYLPAYVFRPSPHARIAIIIDDLGYQFDAGLRALNLPGTD